MGNTIYDHTTFRPYKLHCVEIALQAKLKRLTKPVSYMRAISLCVCAIANVSVFTVHVGVYACPCFSLRMYVCVSMHVCVSV